MVVWESLLIWRSPVLAYKKNCLINAGAVTPLPDQALDDDTMLLTRPSCSLLQRNN